MAFPFAPGKRMDTHTPMLCIADKSCSSAINNFIIFCCARTSALEQLTLLTPGATDNREMWDDVGPILEDMMCGTACSSGGSTHAQHSAHSSDQGAKREPQAPLPLGNKADCERLFHELACTMERVSSFPPNHPVHVERTRHCIALADILRASGYSWPNGIENYDFSVLCDLKK